MGVLVTPSGDVVVAPNGKVHAGGEGANCCTQLYVQARRCSDGDVVDLWFQYDCSLVSGAVACVISTNLGPKPLPFFFKLSGGDGTPYYVPGDDPKCTHGTLAGDVVQIASCGQCFDCSDSRPTSFEISTSGVQIYNKFIQSFAASILGDSSDEYDYARLITFPLDELPSTFCICQSNLGDCLWTHRIKDGTTVTFRHVKKKISTGVVTDLSDEEVAAALGIPGFPSTGTASYDLFFVISKRGFFGEPHWFDFEAYLVPSEDPSTLSDPLIGMLTYITFILFTGRVVAEECEGEFAFSNLFTDYGPFPTDVSPAFPPAYGFNDSILEVFYCTRSAPPCNATWCSDNTPVCLAGSFLAYAFNDDTYIAGRAGDVIINSSVEYCTFEATAIVTIVGSTPNCNSNGFKGTVSTDGTWGGPSDPDYPDGLPLRTPNRIPQVDPILEYEDDTCATLRDPQDTTLDPHSTLTVDVDQGGSEITVTLITALDGIEPHVWFGRKTLDDTDLTFCGYPNGVVIPFGGGTDPSEYNDLPYTGGYAVVTFRGTP